MLTAFWGLESDFGANFGNYNILSALATLAYDCRRPDFFRSNCSMHYASSTAAINGSRT